MLRLLLALASVVGTTSLQLTTSVLRPAQHLSRSSDIVCGRKGRPKMPGGGPQGAYANSVTQQAPKASPDGMPIFYLYCRSGAGKPCAAVKCELATSTCLHPAVERSSSTPADAHPPPRSWYPVSAMKGDGQSKGLINAWLGAPIAKVRVPTASPPKWRHGPTLVPEEKRWQCI